MVPIDPPPLLPATDAAILAKITSGALAVARADTLPRQHLSDGLGSLKDVGARVLGMVLNRLKARQSDAYSHDDYSSDPASGPRAHSKSKQGRTTASGPTPKKAKRAGPRHSSSPSEPSRTVESERETVPVTGSDDESS